MDLCVNIVGNKFEDRYKLSGHIPICNKNPKFKENKIKKIEARKKSIFRKASFKRIKKISFKNSKRKSLSEDILKMAIDFLKVEFIKEYIVIQGGN